MELVEDGKDIDHGLAGGRFATETEDTAPFAMGEKVKTAGAGRVLHGPIKLQVCGGVPETLSRAFVWRRCHGVGETALSYPLSCRPSVPCSRACLRPWAPRVPRTVSRACENMETWIRATYGHAHGP